MIDRKVWMAFFLLALAWGSSFMFIKIAVETAGPLTIVALRLLIGCLGLLLIMRWRRLRLPRRWSVWRHLIVLGVINVATPFVLIVWSESGANGLDSGVASILNSTVPLFSIVIAGLILQMETVTGGKVLGLLTGFAGVVLLLSRDAGGEFGSVLPYITMIVAALCYAIGSSYARRYLRGLQPVVLATGQLSMAVVVVLIAVFLFEDPAAQSFPFATIFALLWLGVFGSCLAYICYFYILERWDATRTVLVTYLLPVVGVTAGVLFLGEQPDWRVLAGGLLILGGVGVVNWRPGRKVRVPATECSGSANV